MSQKTQSSDEDTTSIDSEDYYTAALSTFERDLDEHITRSSAKRKFWFSESHELFNVSISMSVTIKFESDHVTVDVSTSTSSGEKHIVRKNGGLNTAYGAQATFTAEYDDTPAYEFAAELLRAYVEAIRTSSRGVYDTILEMDEVEDQFQA